MDVASPSREVKHWHVSAQRYVSIIYLRFSEKERCGVLL